MMKYIDDDGEVKERKFRLSSTKSANALYRVRNLINTLLTKSFY